MPLDSQHKVWRENSRNSNVWTFQTAFTYYYYYYPIGKKHTNANTRTHTRTHTYTNVHKHSRARTHTHTHTHKHTHTQTHTHVTQIAFRQSSAVTDQEKIITPFFTSLRTTYKISVFTIFGDFNLFPPFCTIIIVF